jgi:DNA-binding MarR family transcriptional regulator
MDDFATYALLTASAAFVVLAIALLYRYRQASQRISASTDLGHDLWAALDARLRKQDERILDMMGRVEVIQSRAVAKRAEAMEPGVLGLPAAAAEVEKKGAEQPTRAESRESREVTPPPAQVTPSPEANLLRAVESRLSRQESQIMEMMGRFEAIQSLLAAERARQSLAPSSAAAPRRTTHPNEIKERDLLQMLSEKPRVPGDVRDRFGVTREHAARLLNRLFVKGLAVRNDSSKPYVYELSDEGRRLLSAG